MCVGTTIHSFEMSLDFTNPTYIINAKVCMVGRIDLCHSFMQKLLHRLELKFNNIAYISE